MNRLLAAILCALVLLVAGRTQAQENLVSYLPVPQDTHEWDTIAISPDGSRVYVGNYANEIAVIDTSDDSLADTFVLPATEDEWIGGIAFNPAGRLFVSTDIAFYELDPSDGSVLQETAVPWSAWWEGPMVFNTAGDRAYLASVYEVFVLQVDPLEIIDTVPGGDLDGLLAMNPGWGSDGLDAYHIAISPDDDRLYLAGDEDLKIIGGLNASADFSGLTLESTTGGGTIVSPRIRLSADGSILFDSRGNAWDTQDLSLLESVDFSLTGFDPVDVALDPTGSGMFFEGFAGSTGGVTYSGESLLVADATTMALVDLDGDASNGVTGIDLPDANGWGAGGAFNGLAIVVHPGGEKLYMAVGWSGALVVSLKAAPVQDLTGFFPRRGGNEGDVTIAIAHTYSDGTSVALRQNGQDVVTAYQTVQRATSFEGIFDLRGVAEGEYQVVVTPAGGEPAQLEGVFTVEPVREDATVEMIGNLVLSYETEAPSRMIVQNTGNVDLRDLMVTLHVTDGTRYRLNLPSMVPGGPDQEQEEWTVADGIEPIWIDRLRAGRSYEFQLILAGPDGVPPAEWDIDVEASVGYLMADPGEDAGGTALGTHQQPLLGELCTVGDALVTSIEREMARQNSGTARGNIIDMGARVFGDTAIETGVSTLKDIVAKELTLMVAGAMLTGPIVVAAMVYDVVSGMKSCYDFIKKLFKFLSIFSFDPNDKISSTGLDGFIEGNEAIRYIIHFENLPEATAPAKVVTIEDPLDEAFDLSTFELVGSSHPDVLSVNVDPATRVMTAVFDDINLPPDVNPPEGQGWLEFTIRSEAPLPHGTVVRNQAEIIFDINDPIVTPEVVLEVDTAAPNSSMAALPEETIGTEIPVTWSGDDLGGVGVWDYSVSVSTNDGPFIPWLEATTETGATFAGEVGNSYRFQVVSRDRFGNVETKTMSDAETRTVEAAGGSTSGDGGGDGGGDDGCGCRTAGTQRGEGLWVALLAVFALAMRRRVAA